MQLSPYETGDSRRGQAKPEHNLWGIPTQARAEAESDEKRRKPDEQGKDTEKIERNLTAFFPSLKDQQQRQAGRYSKNAIRQKYRSPSPKMKNKPADRR